MVFLLVADTLLNVFLAIAVDNLASAQELTAAEEERKLEEEVYASSVAQPQAAISFNCRYNNLIVNIVTANSNDA